MKTKKKTTKTMEKIEKTMDERKVLEKLIIGGDIDGLKEYLPQLEKFQKNLLDFDDPSLVLLAIQVYMDPKVLRNSAYQLDMIVFLLKCGLSLVVPKGDLLLHLWEMAHNYGVSDQQLLGLFQKLGTEGFYFLIQSRPRTQGVSEQSKHGDSYSDSYRFLEENWAARTIQSYWRSYFHRKKV